MSESDPIERLRALRPPPESPEEVHRSMDQILARLAAERLLSSDERFAAHLPKALVGFVRKPAFAAIVAALLLATAFLAMTPAGHAVANWLGEVFGVGEPGGRPSLNGPPGVRGRPEEKEGKSTVLAVASLRDGSRVELVTWRNRQGRPCFAADVAGVERNVWHCAPRREVDVQRPVHIEAIRSGPLKARGTAFFIVGRARRDVASLRLIDSKSKAVIGRAKPVPVPERVRTLIGAAAPFGVFILETRTLGGDRGKSRSGDVSLRSNGRDGRFLGSVKVHLDRGDGEGRVVPADSSEVEIQK